MHTELSTRKVCEHCAVACQAPLSLGSSDVHVNARVRIQLCSVLLVPVCWRCHGSNPAPCTRVATVPALKPLKPPAQVLVMEWVDGERLRTAYSAARDATVASIDLPGVSKRVDQKRWEERWRPIGALDGSVCVMACTLGSACDSSPVRPAYHRSGPQCPAACTRALPLVCPTPRHAGALWRQQQQRRPAAGGGGGALLAGADAGGGLLPRRRAHNL